MEDLISELTLSLHQEHPSVVFKLPSHQYFFLIMIIHYMQLNSHYEAWSYKKKKRKKIKAYRNSV